MAGNECRTVMRHSCFVLAEYQARALICRLQEILTTYQVPQLKYENIEEVRQFDIEVFKSFTPYPLRSGYCQQQDGTVPRNIIESVELSREIGDHSCDNCLCTMSKRLCLAYVQNYYKI
jgi:hypothetical protein